MKAALIALATGIVLAIFTWWLSNDRVQLKYTLSEQIPLRFGVTQEEAVQQLEVKNVGTSVVAGIQVKISGAISEFQVLRNSEADEVKTFPKQGEFELVYAVLPSQGSFRLIFKTKGPAIQKEALTVKHSKGAAEEALSNASSLGTVLSWVQIATVLLYIVIIVQWLRSIGADGWEREAKYDSEKVLRASKPLYMADQKWREVRDKAIDEFGRSSSLEFGDVVESEVLAWPVYRWLSDEKPACLAEAEWQKFRASKTKQLVALLLRRINEGRGSSQEIGGLLRLVRPRQVAAEQWEVVQQRVKEVYVERRSDEVFRGLSLNRSVVKDDVGPHLWGEVEAAVASKRFPEISKAIEYQREPMEMIDRLDLSMLTPDQVTRLKERAYQLQLSETNSMIDEEDAQKFIQAPKPAWIKDADYARRQKMAEGIIRRAKQGEKNMREAAENAKEASEVAVLKKKILQQLSIVDRLFADPTSVERIESYDNPFSAGNFQLLVRLGHLMAAQKDSDPSRGR